MVYYSAPKDVAYGSHCITKRTDGCSALLKQFVTYTKRKYENLSGAHFCVSEFVNE
jgi:hypothetical protein